MGRINSRQKGAVGEREWARYLTEQGFPALRGCQHSGGVDSPDVKGGIPGTHAEVKRVEKLNIVAAMDQAERDCGEEQVPYVAHRRNRKPWLITIKAEDLMFFCERVYLAHLSPLDADKD